MSAWLAQHAAALQIASSFLVALVWVVYLQAFLLSFRRQRRTMLLVSRGAGVGMGARCFISNLGFEPIFLVQVMVRLSAGGRRETAIITDRTELTEAQLRDPEEPTNLGPLKSGELADIGNFRTLFTRARDQVGEALGDGAITAMEVVVVASTAASSTVVGAERRFRLTGAAEDPVVQPVSLIARQIRGRSERRRLRRELEARLLPGAGAAALDAKPVSDQDRDQNRAGARRPDGATRQGETA